MLSTTALAVVGALLIWRIVTTGLDAVRDRDGRTGTERVGTGTNATAFAWRDRLARNPADGYAMVQLGLALEREGKRDEAAAAVRQALRMAPADRRTLRGAAGFLVRTGNETHALLVTRRLVDLYPADGDAVWAFFAKVGESGTANEFFERTAQDNPAWWPQFMRYACERSANADFARQLLLSRRQAGIATLEDRRCVLARLRQDGRWEDAYRAWAETTEGFDRERVGAVFNGGFELPLSNFGFDWIFPVQDGVTIEAGPVEGAGGKRALQVTFAGKRYQGSPVYQQLMLPPGPYRLAFRSRADRVDSTLGVQWAIYCVILPAGELRQLARSDRLLGAFDWSDFHYDFNVPKDCLVHELRLELADPRRDAPAASTAEARVRGTLYFDDFSVRAAK